MAARSESSGWGLLLNRERAAPDRGCSLSIRLRGGGWRLGFFGDLFGLVALRLELGSYCGLLFGGSSIADSNVRSSKAGVLKCDTSRPDYSLETGPDQ